ncbi:MAG: fused MFS/spermidine synthase [Alphaproteobacteria bacterium]|nr:fused MFS/spermidine synthase [Alphaproteobacteria bacterium]
MKIHLYIPVYALTLLLSAALIFAVQPMFSKMVLPLLGGTPQVWNTAMLFFQLMLLAGYAYAHGTSRFLSVNAQAVLHLVLLALFGLALPVAIPAGWIPPAHEDPTFWQLSLMTLTVGGPFFILAGSAPMLQRWFTQTGHPDAHDPYFLYGASNLGSMTALLAYPTVIEPLLHLSGQSDLWTKGYFVLIGLTAVAAALIARKTPPLSPAVQTPANDEQPSWRLRGKWLLLAFIPSSLMLGVTTHITTDIASVPLLWIIPLTLYVGTFIIAFARTPLISRKDASFIFGLLGIALLAYMMLVPHSGFELMALHLGLFFFAALTCHMELVAARPHAARLTEFYLILSLGGALGGIFNALIAPQFFIIPLEYAGILALALFMRYAGTQKAWRAPTRTETGCILICIAAALAAFNIPQVIPRGLLVLPVLAGLTLLLDRRWLFALPAAGCLLLFPPGHNWGRFMYSDVIYQDRSFFGVLKVADFEDGQRVLMHGTTNHGTQAIDPRYKTIPLAYYGTHSPIGEAFRALKGERQNIAVLGLGVGVTSCFAQPGRHFDFFEIDPQVVKIAQNPDYFTFLSDCGSPYAITLGDARLTLADKPDGMYDLILVDVYSSDNIPVHLITLEAIEMYLKKLKPDGILTFNVSNNYLDIEPVLARAAEHLDIPAYARLSDTEIIEGTKLETNMAHFVSLTRNPDHVNALLQAGWSPAEFREGVHLWTDQYSNIVSVLHNRSGIRRQRLFLRKDGLDPGSARP